MKPTIVLTVKIKEWEKVKKRLTPKTDLSLDVGFFREDKYGSDNNNLNVAAVAAWNEQGWGAYNVNIPPRPFMRVGLKEVLQSAPYQKMFKQSFLKIINGKSTVNKEYEQIGRVVVDDLKDIILAWDTPPNAPFTIESKGFNDPLIDTGLMVESVKYKIRKRRPK